MSIFSLSEISLHKLVSDMLSFSAERVVQCYISSFLFLPVTCGWGDQAFLRKKITDFPEQTLMSRFLEIQDVARASLVCHDSGTAFDGKVQVTAFYIFPH